MRKKLVLVFIILVIFISLMFGCSDSEEYVKPTSTPAPTATLAPPTPKPVPGPNSRLWVTKAELSSSSETNNAKLSENKLNCHAGDTIIRLTFSNGIDRRIVPYIYLDGNPLDSASVSADSKTVHIKLPDNLPYSYTLEIKSGYEKNGWKMTEDYKLDFLHEAALTCKISYYDTLLGEDTPSAIYITEENPIFLIEFSKPVDKESLSLIKSSAIMNHNIIWLSDTKALVYTFNLSNGYYTLGVDSVFGESDIFGNRISIKGGNYGVLHFTIIDKQKLYSAVPEAGKTSLLTEFAFGSFFESISQDSQYITIGILTKTDDSMIYETAFLSLGMKKLVPFNSFIQGAVTHAAGHPVYIRGFISYEPYIIKEYWTHDNQYIYYGEEDIFLIDPVTKSAELLFDSLDENPALVFPMKNGNYAAVMRPENPEDYLSLLILDASGSIKSEFKLPITEIIQDGMTRYLAHFVDPGDGTLIISGSDKVLPIATYRLDLENGTFIKISENNWVVGIYPDLGYGIYLNYNEFTGLPAVNFIDFNGNILNSIAVDHFSFNNFIYNPQKSVFYYIDNNYYYGTSTIKIIDPVTFEMTDSDLEFDKFLEIVGISKSGSLLLMEVISP